MFWPHAIEALVGEAWVVQRQAGVVCVTQVYLASASPPVRFPNVYGVDLPSKKEFVATDLSEDQICKVPTLLLTPHTLLHLFCSGNIVTWTRIPSDGGD